MLQKNLDKIKEEKLEIPSLKEEEIDTTQKSLELNEDLTKSSQSNLNEKVIQIEPKNELDEKIDTKFEKKLEFEETLNPQEENIDLDKTILKEIEELEISDKSNENIIPTPSLIDKKDFSSQETKNDFEEFSFKQKDNKGQEEKVQEEIVSTENFSIDLEKNAAKLKIDTNTYKMLIKSFLGEVENNFSKIESSNQQTITMLIDAGNLLALEDLSQLLQKQLNTPSAQNFAEIKNYHKFLLNQINSSPLPQNKDILKEEYEEVDESLIDIKSDKELLKLIQAKDPGFKPKEVEEELGLPLELISNFIQDFISQAKEHLPVFVQAYQKKDLDELKMKAHMLKGAASNLRIKAVANTLKLLEESNNFDEIATYIKKFVGEIKGLEKEYKKLFS